MPGIFTKDTAVTSPCPDGHQKQASVREKQGARLGKIERVCLRESRVREDQAEGE